ncbi:hypothetical protein Sjap_013255 [Stephania japonica]|uniref:Transposase n=1 Tax=Stephania japonica TaxID=461633 RepID=A0AAP0NYF9_9MAGN
MTRQSQNSTPSSSTHHSTPSSYAGGTSAGATHDSPSSSTHPSTSSSVPRQLPHVEMPHDPGSPPELTGERDEPRIYITINNKSLHPSDICARKMTDTFKKGMIPEGCRWKCVPQYQRDIYWERWRSYFDWDPRITAKIMAAYERHAKVRYKALMNKLLSKGERPIYVTEEAWSRYVEYWESDDFKARARSWGGTAEIQRMREEMSQSAEEAGDDPHVDETDLYYKVVGVDHKGRVYGLGSTGRRYNDPGASSSQGPPSQDFATLQSNVSRCLSPENVVAGYLFSAGYYRLFIAGYLFPHVVAGCVLKCIAGCVQDVKCVAGCVLKCKNVFVCWNDEFRP